MINEGVVGNTRCHQNHHVEDAPALEIDGFLLVKLISDHITGLLLSVLRHHTNEGVWDIQFLQIVDLLLCQFQIHSPHSTLYMREH